MTTIKATYQGNLRVECEHLQSGSRLVTEAPVDNQGKGSAFSPTDLCSTALGSCVLTTMGILARGKEIDMVGATASIEKVMTSEAPRKIKEITVQVQMPSKGYTEKEKVMLERAAHTCAVHNTLEGVVEMKVEILW